MILTIWMDGMKLEGTYEEFKYLFSRMLELATLEAGAIPSVS